MNPSGLPRASWSNLQASSPLIVMGLKSPTTAIDNALSILAANGGTGAGVIGCAPMIFTGANYQGLSTANNGDAQSMQAAPQVGPLAFNGSTWDRNRTAAAAVMGATTQEFALQIAKPGNWAAYDRPAANTQASCTKAAGAAGVKHVVTTLWYGATSIGAATANSVVELVEDVAGAATVLFQLNCFIPATGGNLIVMPLHYIQPTAAKSLTWRFTAAGGANSNEFVAMFGFSTK